ncbi:hypothetical protein ONZ45_g3285 [Pleurotus djamor]|nr:hypothetical protein ONZ45_g3285 [Pleurotus djamor]
MGYSATHVHAFPFVLQAVARMSNRALGTFTTQNEAELCRLSMDFTVEVVKASYILFAVPDQFKPLALRCLTRIPAYIERATELLKPSIELRREEPQSDMLSWLLAAAPCEERTDRGVTIRILHLIFASLHTTAMTFTHALYHIASKPEYVQPLRQEMDEVVGKQGWCKASIDEMVKLDSFMQECQRYSPIGAIIMIRKVLKSYQFSDGTEVPVGTTVAVPLAAMHTDENYYQNAADFDGFRFAGSRSASASMTASTKSYLTFGRGKHTCDFMG